HVGQPAAVGRPGGAAVLGTVHPVVGAHVDDVVRRVQRDRVGGQVRQVAADVRPGRTAVGGLEDVPAPEPVAHRVGGRARRRVREHPGNVVGDVGDVDLGPGGAVVGGHEDVGARGDVDGVAVGGRHGDRVGGGAGAEAAGVGRTDDRPGVAL